MKLTVVSEKIPMRAGTSRIGLLGPLIFALCAFAQLAFMSLLGDQAVWGMLLALPVAIVVSRFVAISRRKSKGAKSEQNRRIGLLVAVPLFVVGMAIAIVGALVTTDQTPKAVRVVLGLPGLLAYGAGMYLWVMTFRDDTKRNPPTQGPFRTSAPPDDDGASSSSPPRTPT
jgi:hypothetical protein